MLVYNSRLIGTPVLSVQAGAPIAQISAAIVDPDNLKIIAFHLSGPLVESNANNILGIPSIREYSNYGIVIDSIDELVSPDDVIKIKSSTSISTFFPSKSKPEKAQNSVN